MPDFTRISADRSGEQQRSEPRPEWDEEHRRRIAEPDRSRWSPVVAKRLEQTYEEVADGKSRHEAARSATQMLARYEDEGEVGASAAIEELHVEFVKAKTVIEPRYDLRTVEGDWKRMLDGARENVAATEFDGHRPPKPADLVGEKTERPSWVLPEEFWRRPVLAHVRQAAQARRRAPAAVLGSVLARVAMSVPYTVELPAIVGAPSPLCFFCLLLSPPGGGKSSSNAIAAALLPVEESPLGSGEGLAELLFERVEEADEGGKKKRSQRKQTKHNAFVYIDETRMLGEVSQRSGSTILGTICEIWSGVTAGQSNASEERNRPLPPMSYVYGIVGALQDEYAGAMLANTGAGVPQRFVWLRAVDPTIPEEKPKWPGKLAWKPRPTSEFDSYVDELSGAFRYQLKVASSVEAEIDKTDLAKARGKLQRDALQSHRELLRLRVAALLALLEQRGTVTEEDWRLAKMIMDVNDAVVAGVQKTLAQVQRSKETAAAHRRARQEVEAGEQKVVEYAKKLAAEVRERKATTRRELQQWARRWRDIFDEVFDYACVQGWIDFELAEGQGDDKKIVRPGKVRP